MFDRAKTIRIIEDALDERPYCAVCGKHTEIRDDGGILYVSCPAVGTTTGRLARILATVLAHTNRPILDLRAAPVA